MTFSCQKVVVVTRIFFFGGGGRGGEGEKRMKEFSELDRSTDFFYCFQCTVLRNTYSTMVKVTTKSTLTFPFDLDPTFAPRWTDGGRR